MSLIVDALNNVVSDANIPDDDFYHFEPYDVEERPQWVIDQAEADGINLNNKDFTATGNTGEHLFQSGFLLSTKPFRGSIACTQGGKTYPSKVEATIIATGEMPISLRHERGADTHIRRRLTPENIIRWGRFDSETREFIDHDVSAHKDGTWDCGTITGAGIYPREKLMPNGEVIWIGTTMKALQETWWPWITDEGKRMIPEEYIDRSKANNGVSAEKNTLYLVGGKRITFITYESGFRKFEALRVWWCHFDEESPDKRCLTGAVAHCHFFSISMTPLMGITYTKEMFFPKTKDDDIDVFHASAYDCPYMTPKMIAMTRKVCEKWEIASKIWGLHSANTGEPYYDRMKIQQWTQEFQFLPLKFVEFEPATPFVGLTKHEHSNVNGLVDTEIVCVEKGKDDFRSVWRMYEEVKEGTGYLFTGDAAAGTQHEDIEDFDDDDLGDACTGIITRSPLPGEKGPDGLPATEPVVVLTIKSMLPPEEFAVHSMMACLYYNGALYAPECGQTRGAHNGIVYSENRNYPWWFRRQRRRGSRTRNYKEQMGIDTNTGNRTMIFDCFKVHCSMYKPDEYPMIPDERILYEGAECVLSETAGGKKKPDHPRGGSLDMLIAYCHALWIWKHFKTQVQWHQTANNKAVAKNKPFIQRMSEKYDVDSGDKKSVFANLMNGKGR